MAFLGWILFGFIVGLLARAIVPGHDPIGLIGTTLLGIAGALSAGWMGQALGYYAPDERAGFIAAIVGAITVLLLYQIVRQLVRALDRARYRRVMKEQFKQSGERPEAPGGSGKAA